MQAAADRLTQYLQLFATDRFAKNGFTTDGFAAKEPIAHKTSADIFPSKNGSADRLIAQAKQLLVESAEFQQLLVESVPKSIQEKAQQRLIRRLHTCKKPEQLPIWVKQQLANIVPSVQQDEALIAIIQQIQALPANNRDRRNLIQTLLIEIQTSDRLRRSLPNLPPALYADALHETLLWFCDCIDTYDPTRSGPLSWFNRNLSYQGLKLARSLNRSLPDRFTNTEKDSLARGGPDAYDALTAEAEYQILDDLYDWVQQDVTGELKRTALTDRLDINVQMVIKAVLDQIRHLRRLGRTPTQLYDIFAQQPTDLSQLFSQLSGQIDYPPEKLRRFWREKCCPYIEDFLQQGDRR